MRQPVFPYPLSKMVRAYSAMCCLACRMCLIHIVIKILHEHPVKIGTCCDVKHKSPLQTYRVLHSDCCIASQRRLPMLLAGNVVVGLLVVCSLSIQRRQSEQSQPPNPFIFHRHAVSLRVEALLHSGELASLLGTCSSFIRRGFPLHRNFFQGQTTPPSRVNQFITQYAAVEGIGSTPGRHATLP